MSAAEILTELEQAGVDAFVWDGRLVTHPRRAVPESLVAEIRAHKAELIDMLSTTAAQGSLPDISPVATPAACDRPTAQPPPDAEREGAVLEGRILAPPEAEAARAPDEGWSGSSVVGEPHDGAWVEQPARTQARGQRSERSVVLVDNADDLELAFCDVLAYPGYPRVALDLETWGDASRACHRLQDRPALDPLAATIRLAQFTAEHTNRIYVADMSKIGDPRRLKPLLDHALLIGHNLKFEVRMLQASGLTLPDDLGYRTLDTMLASQVLEAGHRTEHSLAAVAEQHLGLELDKTEQAGDWSRVLTPSQVRYAADDVRHLFPLFHVLSQKLEEAGLIETFLLECRALPAVAWLEQSGAVIDEDRWVALAEVAEQRQAEIEDRLDALAGDALPAGMLPLQGLPPREVNWSSPEQVRALLRERGLDLPSTKEEVLVEHLDEDPLIPVLLEHREWAKRVGTYGREFLKHVHPLSDRIHPDWFQLGSDAGRMSARSPNLQQVPRDPAYRACIRAPAGRVLVKADYSQIELRIAAELAPDRRLLAAFASAVDVHSLTAQQVMGRQEVSRADRQAAKAVGFGLTYGMGATGLRRYAKASYGVEMTEEDAAAYRERFFEAYSGLRAWHRRQPGHAIATRTLGGRRSQAIVRHTHKLNSPVQGTGADMLEAAMGRSSRPGADSRGEADPGGSRQARRRGAGGSGGPSRGVARHLHARGGSGIPCPRSGGGRGRGGEDLGGGSSMKWHSCLLCGEPTRRCPAGTPLCEQCAADFVVCGGCG